MEANIGAFLDYVYEVYTSMRQHEIMLVYEGEITHQVTKAFAALAEQGMAKEEEEGSVQKLVYHVMVECLQNISRHSDGSGLVDASHAGRGIFLVRKGENCYHVTSGNLIENAKVPVLAASLEHINSLDKEGLTAMYKEQIKGGPLSEKGGAGLGFIDIARKTGQKLVYHFRPVDADTQFFILTSTIARTR